jgi:V8-like Glu-specific endopeptidase
VTQRGQTPGIIDGQSCSGIGSAVVLLDLLDATEELTGQCSGTVITPTAVLTAAHCLSGDVATVTIQTTLGAIPSTSIHPISSFREEDLGSLDVGVIITSQSLSLPTFPILVGRPARTGETAVIAGYGSDRGGQGGTLQAGTMTVDRVDTNFIYAVFDGTGSNTCNGDSGGPFFLQEGDTWTIAGVTAGGDTENCLSGTSDFANLQNAEVMSHIFGLVPGAARR